MTGRNNCTLFRSLDGRKAGSTTVATVFALALVVVISFIVYIVRNYHVMAYSDPFNWLSYGNNLSEGFAGSKWPVGYPVFLWLIMKLTGPYYVFLSNMIVLAVLALLVAVAAWASAKESESSLNSLLIGVGCLALLLGYDSSILVSLVNPYRDPLSFVLVVASVLLVSRYIDFQGRRIGSLGTGALLLGMAYCVRETSILMIVPLFIYGANSWRRNREIGFWKSCLVFGVCLLTGALPLLIQSYNGTGQALLPPQSVSSGNLLPGLHIATQQKTFTHAISYFWSTGGWLYLGGLAMGALAAVVRRCRKLLFIFLGGAVVFFSFYSFYEYFYSRYFYIVVVLMMPLVSYGVYKAVGAVVNILGLGRNKTPVYVVLTGLLCLHTAVSLLSEKPQVAQFRIKDAKRFTADMEQLFPDGAFVLSDRHLCEVLDYFTHVDSRPCYDLCREDRLNEKDLRESIEKLRAEGRELFAVTHAASEGFDPGSSMLDRIYTLNKINDFKTADYALQRKIYDCAEAEVYRIEPWSSLEAGEKICPKGKGAGILRIDAGYLWETHSDRSYARLYLDDKLIDEQVESGVSFYPIDASVLENKPVLRIQSDKPVRPRLEPLLIDGNEPIELDFGENAIPSFSKFLSDDFFRCNPSESKGVRSLLEKGSITVPVPWQTRNEWVFVELVVRAGVRMKDAVLDIDFFNDSGGLLRSAVLPADGLGHSIVVPLLFGKTDRECQKVLVDLRCRSRAGLNNNISMVPVMDLDRMVVWHVGISNELIVNIGSDDSVFIVDGFFGPEKYSNRYHCRWMGPEAELDLRPLKKSGDLQLALSFIPKARPEAAGPGNLKVVLNGKELELGSPELNGDIAVLRADIDNDLIKTGENTLVLMADGWSPAEFGVTGDARQLGVMIHKIEIKHRRTGQQ